MTNGENVKLIEQAEFQGSIRAADETPHETELRKFVRNLTAALKAEIARAKKAEAERDRWRELATEGKDLLGIAAPDVVENLGIGFPGETVKWRDAATQWLADFEELRK